MKLQQIFHENVSNVFQYFNFVMNLKGVRLTFPPLQV
jgi:hypothetical protein